MQSLRKSETLNRHLIVAFQLAVQLHVFPSAEVTPASERQADSHSTQRFSARSPELTAA